MIAFRLTSISESLVSYVHPRACPAVRVSCLRTDLSVTLPLFCISHICLCQLVLVALRVPAYSCVFLRAAVGAGVEMFKKDLGQGQAGDNCGILLRGVKREDVARGQVLAKPGSVKPSTKFTAEIYCLTKEEGGRHTPFFKKYKPQFFFRTADVTGTIILPDELEMVMPGDNVSVSVELIQSIVMEPVCPVGVLAGASEVLRAACTRCKRSTPLLRSRYVHLHAFRVSSLQSGKVAAQLVPVSCPRSWSRLSGPKSSAGDWKEMA